MGATMILEAGSRYIYVTRVELDRLEQMNLVIRCTQGHWHIPLGKYWADIEFALHRQAGHQRSK